MVLESDQGLKSLFSPFQQRNIVSPPNCPPSSRHTSPFLRQLTNSFAAHIATNAFQHWSEFHDNQLHPLSAIEVAKSCESCYLYSIFLMFNFYFLFVKIILWDVQNLSNSSKGGIVQPQLFTSQILFSAFIPTYQPFTLL